MMCCNAWKRRIPIDRNEDFYDNIDNCGVPEIEWQNHHSRHDSCYCWALVGGCAISLFSLKALAVWALTLEEAVASLLPDQEG